MTELQTALYADPNGSPVLLISGTPTPENIAAVSHMLDYDGECGHAGIAALEAFKAGAQWQRDNSAAEQPWYMFWIGRTLGPGYVIGSALEVNASTAIVTGHAPNASLPYVTAAVYANQPYPEADSGHYSATFGSARACAAFRSIGQDHTHRGGYVVATA